jgi:hypothetical protein
VAGLFNTGTNALAVYLQANVQLPHSRIDWQTVMEQYKGKHAWEVPWGKHRLFAFKDNANWTNKGAEHLQKDHVLPIVIVRDPYSWMQSMCGAAYKTKWRHSVAHCPNLVPNPHDVARFPGLQGQATVPVVLPAQGRARFDSLAHLYAAWYAPWMTMDDTATASMPHLMVRFEDLLFRPEFVVDRIRDCVQSPQEASFVYLLGPSKWFHAHVKPQSTRISAMIKYGRGTTRLRNMTQEDLQLAEDTLEDLLQAFHYKPALSQHKE